MSKGKSGAGKGKVKGGTGMPMKGKMPMSTSMPMMKGMPSTSKGK